MGKLDKLQPAAVWRIFEMMTQIPHGSGNERLLAQKGSTLCLQCHGVPPRHRTEHSGLGTKLQCVECHSEVHGSNHNAKFLDPDLGSKLFSNCYQSGCHAL